jgi:hypothetical protein
MDGQDWETRILRKKPASTAAAKDEASINAVRFLGLLLLLGRSPLCLLRGARARGARMLAIVM